MASGLGQAPPGAAFQQIERVQAHKEIVPRVCNPFRASSQMSSGGSVASFNFRRTLVKSCLEKHPRIADRELSWSSTNRGVPVPHRGRARRHRRSENSRSTTCRMIGEPAPMGQMSTYKDTWWERAVIHLIVSRMSGAIGQTTKEKGYDAFVDISRQLVKGRPPLQQRVIVMRVLTSSVPSWVFKLARTVFSKVTKLSAEYYAFSTAIFFQWLVGPAKTIEMNVNGVTQRSCVKIEKCRFLESSNCIGMCVNLCKVPSQDFISSSFGIPLYMKPNFEDMSCEMRYGEHPPPERDDPAFNQPCYATLCSTAQQKVVHCAKPPKDSKNEILSENCSIV